MNAHPGFAAARPVADAVLHEGYLLYPYRASAQKNQLRWQFGVLVPAAFADLGERTSLRADVLASSHARQVQVLLRFLHLEQRQVQRRGEDGRWVDVAELVVDGLAHRTFEEAAACEHLCTVPLEESTAPREVRVGATTHVEALRDAAGRPVGQIRRTRAELHLELHVSAEALPPVTTGGDPAGSGDAPTRLLPLRRVRVQVRNVGIGDQAVDAGPGDLPDRWARRRAALATSPLSTHLLLGLPDGRWLSRTAPPVWAVPASRACEQDGVWPVLMGPADTADTVLLSPIILDDQPRIAPESPVETFDGTEIDELLTLRTMTLTEEEKTEARGTDPRAAALIAHADHLSPEMLGQLHGTLRDVEAPAPSVVVGGVAVEEGAVVRLRPRRDADAQDMFLADRLATVEAVIRDLEGRPYLAVTLVDDPGADLQRETGRFRYFSPDEVVPG